MLQIYALFGVKVSVSRKITKTGLVEAFMNVFSVQNILKMFNIYIYTLVKKELFCWNYNSIRNCCSKCEPVNVNSEFQSVGQIFPVWNFIKGQTYKWNLILYVVIHLGLRLPKKIWKSVVFCQLGSKMPNLYFGKVFFSVSM